MLADIVKNDGKNLYVIHGRAFKVINAWPANTLKELTSTDVEGTPTPATISFWILIVLIPVARWLGHGPDPRLRPQERRLNGPPTGRGQGAPNASKAPAMSMPTSIQRGWRSMAKNCNPSVSSANINASSATRQASRQQIPPGRCLPIHHLAGHERAGPVAQHEAGVECVEGHAAGPVVAVVAIHAVLAHQRVEGRERVRHLGLLAHEPQRVQCMERTAGACRRAAGSPTSR